MSTCRPKSEIDIDPIDPIDPIQEIHQRLADAMGAEELQALRAALVGELLEAAVAPPVTNLVRSDGPKLQYVGYMIYVGYTLGDMFRL